MTMLHLLEIILCMYFLKAFQKYLCNCYITVMSVLYSENIFDISVGEIPYKSQVFKIFSGEKCRVCISSKFLHDTFFLTSITLMSVQVYYFIMKVSDYHNFPFYIAVICCSLRVRLCVYRLRVTELGGRV